MFDQYASCDRHNWKRFEKHLCGLFEPVLQNVVWGGDLCAAGCFEEQEVLLQQEKLRLKADMKKLL